MNRPKPGQALAWIAAIESVLKLARQLIPRRRKKTKRERFVELLRSKIGRPYIWGGNGPDEFDCSGLLYWLLLEIGYNTGDATAQNFANRFADCVVPEKKAPIGSIFFYGETPTTINHLMIVLDIWSIQTRVLVGARGGDSHTTSFDAAINHNALVDAVIADTYWRKGLQLIVDPFIKIGD